MEDKADWTLCLTEGERGDIDVCTHLRSLAASRALVEALRQKAHEAYEIGDCNKEWLDEFCAMSEGDPLG